MPPRRPKIRGNLSKKNPAKIKFLFILLTLLGLIFSIYKIYSRKNLWSGEQKMAVVVQENKEDVSILIFDPVSEEITRISIPGNTQVEVAGNLGVWKIKSVWDLGKNENLDGSLLAKTVAKNFKFPVYVWSDKGILGFLSTNPFDVIKAIVLPYETKLGVIDKILIGSFSLNIKNANRIDVDLRETLFLKKLTLTDGTEGFGISNLSSQNILAKFADHSISGKNYTVIIRDSTGEPGVSEKVGEIVEVFGGKVASIKKEEDKDALCAVWGKDTEIAKKVASIFGCELNSDPFEGNFDLEITLGNKFTHSF